MTEQPIKTFESYAKKVKEFAEELEKIEQDTERDYYLSAKEALDYGIIDKIL